MYYNLDAQKIVDTVRRLRDRIGERFPGAGLGRVAEELLRVAEKAGASADAIARPLRPLRVGMAILAVLFLIVMGWILRHVNVKFSTPMVSEFLQAVDAALNTILLIGGAIFSLFTLEVRLKRNRALKLLHELRSLAHVVDMHQLTKDPETILRPGAGTTTFSRRTMTRYQLSRYLGYCSEMSALIGKVAALYVQRYDDPVVLSAVDQIEDLTTSLSRKAWQKITVNTQLEAEGFPREAAVPGAIE